MTESLSKVMKEELVGDFNAVVTKAEQFLKFVADEGEDKAGTLRGQVQRNLRFAKDHLSDVEDSVTRKARATARAADVFVHENPWQTLGASAGIGVILGVAIGVLFYRR